MVPMRSSWKPKPYPWIVGNRDARVKGVRRALFVGVTYLLVSGSVSALAAPFDPIGRDWEGYAELVRILREEVGSPRVVVTGHLDWNQLGADDALLVAFPERPVDSDSAGAFVRAGGRLALLDDFGAGDDLLRTFDVERVPLPRQPALALRDNPAFAIAEPVAPQPLTDGVDRVVTNHATGFRQPLLAPVLSVRGADGGEVSLALAGISGRGRLLLIGDPSIAINSMLRFPGNLTFTRNVARYVVSGHDLGKLYVVVGRFAETGAFAGVGSAWWRDALRGLASLGRETPPSWFLYWLSFVVTVLILLWLLPRALRTYRPSAPRFTRPLSVAASGGLAGRAASLGAPQAYRGYAMLEWRGALREALAVRFGLPVEVSGAELVRRVRELRVVDREAVHALEQLLVRMAEIDTMIAAKQTHALEPIRDDEVVSAGELVQRVLAALDAHGRTA